MDDQDRFKQAILALGEVFDKEVSAAGVKLYWAALKEFSDDQVHEAIHQSVNTLKFIPKPSEIRNLILGGSKEISLTAWGLVIKEIRRTGSYGTPRVNEESKNVIDSIGGWKAICALTYRELEFKAKEFQELYEGKETRGMIQYEKGNQYERLQQKDG
jgi:hypothetical protein